MGGSGTPSVNSANESMASVLNAYSRYLPGIISGTAAQQTGTAQAQLAATQATQPGYNQLNLEQAQQYAVPDAQVGQAVTRSNALAGAETNLAQMRGAGGESAVEALNIAKKANPYYYDVMDASSAKTKELLNATNLKGLSPGEQNAVERSLGQSNTATNNLGIDNATNAVSNAMNFGSAYQNKLAQANTAIGTANNVANTAQNTGFNPVNIALGQPNASTMSNFGTGTFTNTNAGTQNASGSNTFGFGSSLLNGITSANNSANQAGAQVNAANISTNSSGALLGSVCCFIMLEGHRGMMPDYIRPCRDKYYNIEHDIASGYRRVAYHLVPLMRKHSLVRNIVWHCMVSPITDYLGYLKRRGQKFSRTNQFVTHFWLKTWAILGRGKNEYDFNKVKEHIYGKG